MSKCSLIQNIGGLTSLLCHLLHSRRFSGHFVEPGRYYPSSNITFYKVHMMDNIGLVERNGLDIDESEVNDTVN
jgi:hypothetical protein